MVLTCDGGNELPSKVLNVRHRERRERVLLEEVEHRRSEQLEDQADVVPVVEALHQMDTFAERNEDRDREKSAMRDWARARERTR